MRGRAHHQVLIGRIAREVLERLGGSIGLEGIPAVDVQAGHSCAVAFAQEVVPAPFAQGRSECDEVGEIHARRIRGWRGPFSALLARILSRSSFGWKAEFSLDLGCVLAKSRRRAAELQWAGG
jgi:hypothetical protein